MPRRFPSILSVSPVIGFAPPGGINLGIADPPDRVVWLRVAAIDGFGISGNHNAGHELRQGRPALILLANSLLPLAVYGTPGFCEASWVV
jgi:hypothetical protein